MFYNNGDNLVVIQDGSYGIANHSLARIGSTPYSKMMSFSPHINFPGLHIGENGVRPVIYTSKYRTPAVNAVQFHPDSITRT